MSILGLVSLAASGAGTLIGLLFLGMAALLVVWESPTVVVNTAGGDFRRASGGPWSMDEAEQFVRAVGAQLFND